MKGLKEKNIEVLIIQRKDEFRSFPEDDPRLKAYKKIFTILKEALQFSGLPLDGINLKYNDNYFSVFEKEKTFYGVLSSREVSIDEVLELFKEEKPEEKKPEEVAVKEEVEKKRVEKKPAVKPEKPAVKKPPAPPPEEGIKVSPEVFEEFKKIARDYLGAFADTIFENQLKDARIKPQDATLGKTKKFILNIQNAASMIIGPSQAKEMGKKMRELLP